MSRIRINSNDLGTSKELETVANFLSKIENVGNDVLEIVVENTLPLTIIEMIKKIHLTDVNKELRLVFYMPDDRGVTK